MNKFELIIFDCDGVLVDSERITTEIFSKVLEDECGLSPDTRCIARKIYGAIFAKMSKYNRRINGC